jgi:hypothetical protein
MTVHIVCIVGVLPSLHPSSSKCGQRRVLAAADLLMPLLKLLAVALYLPVLVGAER